MASPESPASSPEPEDELEASRAPFLQHLEELRWRLWRSILGVIGAAVVCFMFHDELFEFLTRPLFDVLAAMNLPPQVKFRTIPGAFLFHFKTALLGGIFFGVPVVLYQAWQFVAPGLYKHERKRALPFVMLATICFVGGGAFAYYMVLPEAFAFLIGYTITDGPQQLIPDITIEDYLGFTSKLLLAFGLVFLMPVAISFLAWLGLVTHRGLIRIWRWAIVGAFVLGALLTPPDYITQTMLAVPLIGLYGISIGLAYFITRGREAALSDGDGESDAGDGDASPDPPTTELATPEPTDPPDPGPVKLTKD